mgnify:FL=1
MRISLAQLKKLEIETKSGVVLGHVKNIILETEGQNVLQYEVGGLVGKKFLISREQVISIDEKKMVVDDNVAGEKESEEEGRRKVVIEPEGAMMKLVPQRAGSRCGGRN